MLDRVIRFSIENKLIIGLLTLLLVAWGSWSLTKLPIDAVPDITNNQVQVITNAPALSALDIERLVTFPVEQTMATIPRITEMRSFSRFGLSVITIVFEDDVDVYWARQQVAERLTEAKEQIPPGAGTPAMMPVTTGLGEIYQYVLHADSAHAKEYDAMKLREIQDWIVRRQLLGVSGVADVSSFGGFVKQFEVALDPARLRSTGITLAEILQALERNNQNTGGAYIDKNPRAWFVRSIGLAGTMEDLNAIVVKNTPDGAPILMRDVATVQLGHAVRYGAMTRNTEGEVVGAIVMMLKGANSNEVIANVKERIEQIKKTLPEGVVIEPFLDRTKLVNSAISTVTKNLAEGALIVILVLVLMLGQWRAGLIVASVIPLAMLFAIGCMRAFGVSGNLMSLGAIDFGLIVDGAVIIVEATLHHLHRGKREVVLTQKDMNGEVYEAASKIRSSAAFGEIIILIVYLPILALVGVEGKMFKPMAQTVSFAIAGAFILSLTYVPMMSALFLKKTIRNELTMSDRFIAWVQRGYAPWLERALRARKLVVVISIALFLGALALFMGMGGEFIPTLDEGDFAVETRVLTGSSVSHTVDRTLQASEVLLKNFPEVEQVVGKIGSSEIPTDPMPIEACDLMVILKDKDEWTTANTREALADSMAKALEVLAGVSFSFQQPIQMRFNELMSGAKQDVVLKIYGEDLDELTRYAKRVGAICRTVPGAQDIYVEQVSGLPQIVMDIDRQRLARFGLSVEEVNATMRAGFAGQEAGTLYEGERRFSIVVRLEQGHRQSIEDLQRLFVTSSSGVQVPLGQVADIRLVDGPNQIQRDDAKRRITVAFNVRGRDVESIVEEVKGKITSDITFKPGYYVTYGGMFENLVEARGRLAIAVPVALFLILILLYFTFGSIRQGLLIFSAIPLSAIGGVLALWLRGMPFSISAGVGFIALFGVAVLNGIVLIGEFNRQKKEGHDLLEVVRRGAAVRLRPVLLTAMVASLGFLPMALSGSSGAEVQRPLATVVIGGLLTATLLTLLVLPVLYVMFEPRGKRPKRGTAPAALLVLLLAVPCATQAQQPMSLEQAMAQAIATHPQLKAATLQVESKESQRTGAFELGNTQLVILNGQYNSALTDRSYAINQPLPLLQWSGSRKLSNADLQLSEAALTLTQSQLLYNVRVAFADVQRLQALVDLRTRQDSALTGYRDVMEQRYKAGDVPQLQALNAQVQALEANNALLSNRAELDAAAKHLQLLIGTAEPVRSVAALVALPASFTGEVPADAPAVAFMRQQVEVAQAHKRVEQAKLLPEFGIGYFDQSLIGTPLNDGRSATSSDRFTGVQLSVGIPLWFVPGVARTKAADLQQKVAEQELASTLLQQQSAMAETQAELERRTREVTYYQEQALPQARKVREQAARAMRSGQIAQLEFLQVIGQSLTIEEGAVNALHAQHLAVGRILYITGEN
jgi:cobalt-zinc-cadmium resistance protein CzcA